MAAYCMEYKMMMTTLLSSLLSLISLHHMLSMSLTVTWSCLSIGSFVALCWPLVASHCPLFGDAISHNMITANAA